MAQYRTDTKKLDQPTVTRYEVMMLDDRLTSSGTLTDAFGRVRMSTPYTLFDSVHRYKENSFWETSTNGVSANAQHSANESTINLNVGTTSGEYVYRETKRVFVYQPGKSLLIMNTFVMNTPKTNLRQRVGFFNSQNGVFIENDGVTNYLVLRSYVTGSVVERRVAQSEWNYDKFDGSGYSSQGNESYENLDLTKANIFWTDIEWLGVGDVRCGFVVDGKLITAHVFHNDNLNTTTYMTTATLPLRYEIENTGTTASISQMKQICSSVQSEGGYELRGRARSIGRDLSSPMDLGTTLTYPPIISIRLKDSFSDAVVLLTGLNFFGVTNNSQYRYKIINGGTLTGANWVSVDSDSAVEYDVTATALTGGVEKESGYVSVAAGSGAASEKLRNDDLFDFQLQRNPFLSSNKGYIISLVATGSSNGDDAVGSLSWIEVT